MELTLSLLCLNKRIVPREKSLGTFKFYWTDAITNIESQDEDINERIYSSTNLGTWISASDVDIFLNRFNRRTAYKDGNTKLSIGNYVTIQDGTYNSVWEIAGFDMEHNQTAADGTVYNNGHGICMIPKTQVTTGQWNTSRTTDGGYKSSYMHTTILPEVISKLQTILGYHMVNRNVLLSNSVVSNYASAYTWTTAYATLMSIGQMTGNFAANRNKYDDGEANYKLPVFYYENFITGSIFWTRGILSNSAPWAVYGSGDINSSGATGLNGVRPLIYLR